MILKTKEFNVLLLHNKKFIIQHTGMKDQIIGIVGMHHCLQFQQKMN